MRYFNVVIMCFVFLLNTVYAYDKVFLQTARTAGIGSAITAGASDLNSSVINPAGAGKIGGIQVMGDMSNLYGAGFENSLLGLYYPLFSQGGAGVIWQRVNYEQALSFDLKEDNFHFLLAKQILKFDFGIAVKYLTESLAAENVNYRNTCMDYDIGLIRSFNRFGLGLSLLNINCLSGAKEGRTAMFNAGIFFRIIQELKFSFDYRKADQQKFSTGLEYYPIEELGLRLGWYIDFYYGFGLSYSIRRFRIDYALALNQYSIGSTHYIGVNYFY